MGIERWFVDDWELTQGWVRNVEYRSGLSATPAVFGANASVPGLTGELWRPKRHGAGRFVLNLWVAGANNTQAAAWAVYEDVLRAVARPTELLVFKRTMDDGSQRQCRGEVITAIEPIPVGDGAYRMAIEVGVPSGYWESVGTFTDTSATGSTLPRDLSLTTLNPSTAPMEHLTYTITGPITNPKVSERINGADLDSFTFTGVVGATQTLIVNASTWALTGSGTPTFTPSLAALSYTSGRFLSVKPARPGGTAAVRMTGSAGGTTTRLQVSGRQAFLV
jgi:hypothetical protein